MRSGWDSGSMVKLTPRFVSSLSLEFLSFSFSVALLFPFILFIWCFFCSPPWAVFLIWFAPAPSAPYVSFVFLSSLFLLFSFICFCPPAVFLPLFCTSTALLAGSLRAFCKPLSGGAFFFFFFLPLPIIWFVEFVDFDKIIFAV